MRKLKEKLESLDSGISALLDSHENLILAIDELTEEIKDLCSLLREQREWKYEVSGRNEDFIRSVLGEVKEAH